MGVVLPRLILHIGQTKAGSTAIQNYLDSQRDALAQCGFLVPELASSRLNPFNAERTAGHLSLVRTIFSSKGGSNEELSELQNSTNIVLSAENLFLDRPDGELKALADFFPAHAITLVLVVRSTGSWLVSRYIEDVVSGFKSRTSAFSDFCEDMIGSSAHNYAARLEHVVSLLGPAEVRLINYDAEVAGNGIVPAFLAASGLPVTDSALACSIRSNVRENLGFMIESKRRLNHVAGALPLRMRLELEAQLRTHAQNICAALPVPALPWDLNAPLSPRVCQEVVTSNRRLVEEFGLSPSLPDPEPHPGVRYQHRRHWPAADELTTFGLKTIAQLLKNEAEKPDRQHSQPLLSTEGSALAVDILARSRVTLHFESSETVLWAACHSGKLPVLLAERTERSDCDKLLNRNLPSDVICIKETGTWPSILNSHSPEVVVVPLGVSLDRVASYWRSARDDAAIVLLGHDFDALNVAADRLDLVCRATAGKTHILGRPER